jgi:hypothetical protein
MNDMDEQLDEMVSAACVVCAGVVEPAYRGTSLTPKCEACQASDWTRWKARGSNRARPYLVMPDKPE